LRSCSGILGQSRARRDATDGNKAVVGIALGVVALVASAILLLLLRHLLVRVVHDINLGGA
jgi:hypothetical protein